MTFNKRSLILAFDTYYFEDKARTVCLSFNSWTETENFNMHCEVLENIEEYKPGEFYKRELPCILSLLKQINCDDIQAIIIDGFVFLDDDQKLGLGGHLYHNLDNKIPVIGVAKSNFATIDTEKRALLRGGSKRPIFITSIGIAVADAAEFIKGMSGAHRIPSILKKLDTLTRKKNCGYGEVTCKL